jgi:DNA repair protein SbcC/Rad50
LSEEINLDQGSTLLWGNIGSGKSSILLAVEFALFGLQRGSLSGASLLRNGEDYGSVEVSMEIEGEKVIIFRSLKRKMSSVAQDLGYIEVNGDRKEGTAIELKQEVLRLLNYPRELLTKSKILMYRYTVYTPQEEMKQILLGNKEERLDTLRKVFGVDKYKRIKENCKVVVSKIKDNKRIYEGMSLDLTDKIFDKEKKNLEKGELDEKLKEVLPKVELFKSEIERKQKDIEIVERKREQISKIKKEIDLTNLELKHKLVAKGQDSERVELLLNELMELEEEDLEIEEDFEEMLKEKEIEVKEKEIELRKVLNKIQELKTRISHSEHIREKVERLSNCPTCFQEVSQDYKGKVVEKSSKEIELLEKERFEEKDKELKFEEIIKNLKKDIELLRKKSGELKLIKHKIALKEKKLKEKEGLKERLGATKKLVGELNTKILELQASIEGLETIEEIYQTFKGELDKLNDKFRVSSLEKVSIESRLKPFEEDIAKLEIEIQKKQMALKKKEEMGKLQYWLLDYFMPMMDKMERNILFRVHSEFSSLFENWFSILMGHQNLKMSLDEEYSPKILQNGYDIEYGHLSGGEKTAGALAYRLALNQVINDLNSGLKTNDLLILDEPTDGFSQEQLERLQVLMEEIKIPQILIVSHEPKIESFVDNIIRLEKQGHVTKTI